MSSKATRAIMRRIKNLLDMAQHEASNENEAAIAMSRAEKLMRKHQISMADVTADRLRESDFITGAARKGVYTRTPAWVWDLAWAASWLTDAMPKRVWVGDGTGDRRKRVTFNGLEEDVEVACLMFDYLVSTVDRITSSIEGGRSYKNSFRLGMSDRIAERASAIKKDRETDFFAHTGKDLVLIKSEAIQAAMGLKYSESRTVYYEDEGGFAAGTAAGENVGLDKQLSGTQQERLH